MSWTSKHHLFDNLLDWDLLPCHLLNSVIKQCWLYKLYVLCVDSDISVRNQYGLTVIGLLLYHFAHHIPTLQRCWLCRAPCGLTGLCKPLTYVKLCGGRAGLSHAHVRSDRWHRRWGSLWCGMYLWPYLTTSSRGWLLALWATVECYPCTCHCLFLSTLSDFFF